MIANFENGFSGLDTGKDKQGGVLNIVADPTHSGKGNVQRSTIGGGNPPLDEYPGSGYLVTRLYPALYSSFKPAPCEAKNDIWLSKELFETTTTGRNFIDILDIFDKYPQDGGQWSSALQAILDARMSVVGGKTYLRLISFDERDAKIWAQLESNPPELTPEQWHTVSIFVEPSRDVRLYQDGQLVAKGTVPSHNRVGLVGGHPGLYGYNHQSSPPMKGYLLVDNWEMRCW